MAPRETRRASSPVSPEAAGRKELRLVDHHKNRVPVIAVSLEKRIEKDSRRLHLAIRLQPFQIENNRHPVRPHPGRNDREIALACRRIDHHMTEAVRQGDEITFRIDDDLLDPGSALLEQTAQKV